MNIRGSPRKIIPFAGGPVSGRSRAGIRPDPAGPRRHTFWRLLNMFLYWVASESVSGQSRPGRPSAPGEERRCCYAPRHFVSRLGAVIHRKPVRRSPRIRHTGGGPRPAGTGGEGRGGRGTGDAPISRPDGAGPQNRREEDRSHHRHRHAVGVRPSDALRPDGGLSAGHH